MGINQISVVKRIKRAVFLDRDGVLNKPIIINNKPYPPRTIEELEIVADAPKALRNLKNAGFLLICVTNQPDVARRQQKKEIVEEINRIIFHALELDDIFVCYHDTSERCECRKPLPGLLLAAAKKYLIELKKSYIVGDRWRDIEAGKNAGCKTIFLDYNYDEQKLSSPPDAIVTSLSEAVNWILRTISKGVL